MILLAECFPLLIGVAPKQYDAAAVQRMIEAFEPYFRRRERYAFVSVQPQGSITPGPAERKLLMEWVDSPRVRHYAGELCVAATAVVDGALMRGALTALLWFWQPPFPLDTAATPAEGIRSCLDRLVAAGVPLPIERRQLQIRATRRLAASLGDDLL